jgi:serine/threonine protein kinase
VSVTSERRGTLERIDWVRSPSVSDCNPLTPLIARSKSFVGTAEYVCPELLIQKEAGLPLVLSLFDGWTGPDIVFRADLWSLGCTIYQFFAGRAPFKAPSEYLIFNLIENRTFIFPEHFPESAKDLVDQLLVCHTDMRARRTVLI